MSPWFAPVIALTFLLVGLLIGWGVFSPARPWFPPKPAPPEAPPPGLEYASRGFCDRYRPRARQLGRHVARCAFHESGISPAAADELARTGQAADVAERAALDLAQAAWVEGARALAAAVKRSSPLPEPVTVRLLDIGYAEALRPSPPA